MQPGFAPDPIQGRWFEEILQGQVVQRHLSPRSRRRDQDFVPRLLLKLLQAGEAPGPHLRAIKDRSRMNAGRFEVRLYPEKTAAVDPPLRVIRTRLRIEQGE